jgi:coenzyme F420-reducing hydrogenase gamma subunit
VKSFAVLQLSGCAGCEVSLLNSQAWLDQYRLVYMPLVISADDVPPVDLILVSGGVRTSEDLFGLRRAAECTEEIVAVGTCAISGGVASLGDRDDVRHIFLADTGRPHVPQLLPRCHPIDAVVPVTLYLPGCPPTSELYMAALGALPDFQPSKIVCHECKRQKLKDVRPQHLFGSRAGPVLPDICLINQGFLCIGSSTRGGCRAPCPRAGFPCVGCRGPSDTFIDKGWAEWMERIRRVFESMTDIPPEEVATALRSPHLALFLFQFADYVAHGNAGRERPPRPKEKIL